MTDDKSMEELRKSLHGRLIRPDEDGYDDARQVFNSLIDKRPELIVRCADAEDVIKSVNFARENDLMLAIRCGGHNVTGKAVCDGGLVIDLSEMKSVQVDPENRTAYAEGGATWDDFDQATQAFGLATNGGIVPSTGIAGLTLGGGIGHLNRKYGLSCDNLLSADVVTADGRMIKASDSENADLFWGLRGGGGNLGVVTAFEYRVHPVRTVLAGQIVYPLERAKEVLRFYRDWSIAAPDEMRADATLLSGPDGPALAIIICFCGPTEEGEKLLKPLRQLASPVADTVAPVPYLTAQNLLTEVLTPGNYYWKAGFFSELSDEAIDAMVDFFAGHVPPPLAVIAIEQLGGAVSRVDPQDTAFSHRHVQHSVLILKRWDDPEETEPSIDWARACYRALAPFVEEGVYVNYLGEEGESRVRAAYGANYERLAAVKHKYDPMNLFRVNQNIKPARERPGPA